MALYTNGNKVGIGSLGGLSDVDLTNPTDGQLLKYNGTSGEWENAGISADEVSPKLVLSIPANTYNTFALALEALWIAYSALSDEDKSKTVLLYGNSNNIYHNNSFEDGRFVNTAVTSNSIAIGELNFSAKTLIGATLTTTASYRDYSSFSQVEKLDLYII